MAVLTNFPADISATDARDTLNAILSRLGTLEGAGSGITLALSAAQSSAEGTTQTYTVTRSGNMNVDVVVTFSTAGTGTNPLNAADHQGGAFPAATKTIAAGASTTTFAITSNDDADVEPDETGLLTISSTTANVTITKATSVYTFTNNDTSTSPAPASYGPLTVQSTPTFQTNSTKQRAGFDFVAGKLVATWLFGLDAAGANCPIAVYQVNDNNYSLAKFADGARTVIGNTNFQVFPTSDKPLEFIFNADKSIDKVIDGVVSTCWSAGQVSAAIGSSAIGTYCRVQSDTSGKTLTNARITGL